MDKKYYTPQIEEFRVGFEYEELINKVIHPRKEVIINGIKYEKPEEIKGVWIGQELDGAFDFEWEDIYEAFEYKAGTREKLRVKYLDSEDIESLGFKEGLTMNTNRRRWDKERWCISTNDNFKTLVVYEYMEEPVFKGTIKNKSELEMILKMIGVIE